MKYIIKKILKEQISEKETQEGFKEFYELFRKNYEKTENFDSIVEELISDIKKSPTPKITLSERGMFCGMSLTDNVILNSSMFNRTLYGFIFVLFHEIAHQYQYKKYGKNLLYDLTTNELTESTLDKLMDIEQVADRFGKNMANKYSTKFNIPKGVIVSPYANRESGKHGYRRLIQRIQEEIKKGTVTCVEQMEKFMTDDLVAPEYPTYRYTGTTYGGYGSYGYDKEKYTPIGRYSYRDYDYDNEYEKYDKGYQSTNEYEKEIKEKYEDKLVGLSYDLTRKINDLITNVESEYDQIGVNIIIDKLTEEGFRAFFYEEKEEVIDDINIDMEELEYEIDENFYQYIVDLKEYVDDELNKMMDDVEKTYGWDASEIFIEMMENEGFDDLWIG